MEAEVTIYYDYQDTYALTMIGNTRDFNNARQFFMFLVAEQLYKHSRVYVCLSVCLSVCLFVTDFSMISLVSTNSQYPIINNKKKLSKIK